MRLSEILYKYDGNQTLKVFLDNAMNNPLLYVRIEESNGDFVVSPTTLFLNAMMTTKSELILDKNLKIKEASCSCLNFYKNNSCIHEAALYTLALMIINKEKFDKEYSIYLSKKESVAQNVILNSLAETLRVTNPYFGLLHLIPVVEVIQGEYILSLKIGYDKDYIIKDINEFIDATENNKVISYGQRLEFTHSYECFDDVSKDLYTFVSNISTVGSQKFIRIRKSQLLKLFEIYMGKVVLFKAQDRIKFSYAYY